MSSTHLVSKKTKLNNDTPQVVIEGYKGHEGVPYDVTHVRFHPSVVKVENQAFYDRSKLVEVVLNEGLREIGQSAFRYTALQSINIPSTVTKIGNGAFYGCKLLQSINIPSTVEEIGEDSFYGCTSLQCIAIPSTVNEIGRCAFHDCSNLREVVLNEGLRKIGGSVFHSCTSLQRITIPSTITEIGYSAFRGCTNLRDVVLNDGLKDIDSNAFERCTSLQSITIPSTVYDIRRNAFYYCTNLQDVVLNSGLKRIGRNAFGRCTLERITIPSTVCISDWAFDNCTNLREVVIHNEGVQVGGKSFVGCTSLQRFKFSSLSTRLNNVIQAWQRDIETKLDDISAVEWRAGELVIPTVSRQIEGQWGRVETSAQVDEEKLDKIVRLIRYYELKEATSLFELALWKAKIDQVDDVVERASRGAYRVDVPGPVKDTILHYLR